VDGLIVAAGRRSGRDASARATDRRARRFGARNRYLHARMLIALIIFWALLGAAVFFAAMRGGRRRSHAGESKAGRRLVMLGVVVAFAFGLVVPALVLAFNAANKASVGAGGIHLNAQQQKGRDLFAKSCAVCHTLEAAKAVGRIGPNLDVRVGEDIATPAGRKALVLSAIAEGRARGLGQMPAGLYQGKEAEDVASFVAAVAGH
jgi:cytochrome c551